MIALEFSEQEKKALYYERFHHPHPRVQLKIEAVWLKSQDIPQSANLSISWNIWEYFTELSSRLSSRRNREAFSN